MLCTFFRRRYRFVVIDVAKGRSGRMDDFQMALVGVSNRVHAMYTKCTVSEETAVEDLLTNSRGLTHLGTGILFLDYPEESLLLHTPHSMIRSLPAPHTNIFNPQDAYQYGISGPGPRLLLRLQFYKITKLTVPPPNLQHTGRK